MMPCGARGNPFHLALLEAPRGPRPGALVLRARRAPARLRGHKRGLSGLEAAHKPRHRNAWVLPTQEPPESNV